jgi:hypothetical protein
MVSASAPATTMALLRKYRPMCAPVHARAQLSRCRTLGRPHGSVRISSSLLNDVTSAHSSGNVVSSAHATRKMCEKALMVRSRISIRSVRGG